MTVSVFSKITYFHAQKQPTEVFLFYNEGVLRNFAKFTGKHMCQSLFFNKVAGLRPRLATLNTFGRLLLHALDPEWVENSNGTSENVIVSAIISIF